MNIPSSRRRWPTLTAIFLCLAAFSSAQTPAHAQAAPAPTGTPQVQLPTQAAFAALAERAATALTTQKAKRVAIADFASDNDDASIDAIGVKLAAEFRAALEQQPHKFKVVSNTDMNALLSAHHSIAADMQTPESALWLLNDDEIKSWVVGTLTTRDGELKLEFGVFHRHEDRLYQDDSFAAVIGRVADLDPVGYAAAAKAATVPTAGAQVNPDPLDDAPRYGSPRCTYCPPADYPDAAVKAHVQGVVYLSVIVTVDGRAENIRVVKRLPLGLTEKAIETVRKWKFIPATGPDGKPAPVRQMIEVQFHLG